jgi:hypothetical protein
VLTETGYIIAEIDSVPGGIGLTGWLSQTYASLGAEVIGGADGMQDGFRSLLPGGGDILGSEESANLRPEMNWVAAQLNARHQSTSGASSMRKAISPPPGGTSTASSRCRPAESAARARADERSG